VIVFCIMMLSWVAADLLWWWIARKAAPRTSRGRAARVGLGLFVAAQVFYMLFHLIGSLAGYVPNAFPLYWHVSVYLWHFVVLPLTLLIVLPIWLGSRLIHFVRRREISPQGTPISRRRLLGATAVAAIPPAVTLIGGAKATADLGRFRVREVEIPIPSLPADLDGVTIAHVSDLHVGKFLPRGMARKVVDATNALKADIIAYTGDLIDFGVEDTAEGLEFLKRLDPRQGMLMIEGNHDMMDDARRFEREVLAAGMPLLLDESRTITLAGRSTPLQFSGITWGEWKRGDQIGRIGREAERWYRMRSDEAMAESVRRVASQREDGAFAILLAHHPHAFDPAAAAGFPLVLAGHTHGGQIMLTEHLGAGSMRFRYWSGLYRKPQSSMLVSNGVGNWFPLRLNAPPEIAKVTLRRA
jgi:predicted MPP superfamily phosphohydrolase